MTDIRTHRLPAILLLTLLATVSSPLEAAKNIPERVDAILTRYPAGSADARDGASREIFALGPKALHEVFSRLRGPFEGPAAPAEYMVGGLALTASRPGARKERQAFIRALHRALKESDSGEVKAFLISIIQRLGGTESIRILEPFLSGDRLRGPAVRALVSIGGPRAESVLVKAADRGPARAQVEIINGLAEMQGREAVRRLLYLAAGPNPEIRIAARHALAESGDPRAAETLSRVNVDAPAAERDRAPAIYIRFAERLAENGHSGLSLKIAQNVLNAYTAPRESPIRSAALRLVAMHKGDAVLPDLLRTMDDGDKSFRGQALLLASGIAGPEATAAWISRLAEVQAEIRAEIIAMLGERGDPAAYPAALKALESEDAGERRAAVIASVRLGGPSAAQHVFPLLETAGEEDAAVIAEALLQAPADILVPLVVKNYETASPAGRTALLGILAARRAGDRIDFILEQTADENPSVKRAALAALENTAGPKDLSRLLDRLAGAADAVETVSLQNAVVAAAGRMEDPAAAVGILIECFHAASNREKIVFLRPLSRLGGPAALDAVTAAAASGDVRLRGAAVSVLGQWPNVSAAAVLKDVLLSEEDRRLRIPALEGYVRLIVRSGWSAAERFSALQAVFDPLGAGEDGKIVIRALASVRSPEAFRLLAAALHHPVYAADAAQALLQSADGASPEEWWFRTFEAVDAVRKARDAFSVPEDRERASRALEQILADMGYRPLFNGRNLEGWSGLVADPPIRSKMSAAELRAAHTKAEEEKTRHWRVEDGILVFDGKGANLCTDREYGDFDLLVDWKIAPGGDSGIYLRGTPQVQIWDADANPEGSGGLYNNQKGVSKPLKRADRPAGEWNSFRIVMMGERVWVFLNNAPVVDGQVMENYWDRGKPVASSGAIELQAHGNPLWFRDIYIREIPRDRQGAAAGPRPEELAEGFTALFNGRDLAGWTGDRKGYAVENGKIIVRPESGSGNLYTEREYADFVLRFEFKLTPSANNGLGVRTPREGDAAYSGMEIQILDDGSPVYRDLRPYQYHGSVYGIVPAARGRLKPVGEWNTQEVIMRGRRATVVLNGAVIVDADLDEAAAGGPLDGRSHAGLQNRRGHIAFLGHGSRVEFRNIRIKILPDPVVTGSGRPGKTKENPSHE